MYIHNDGKSVTLDTTFDNYITSKEKTYTYDSVLPPSSNQQEVFNIVSPLISSVTHGYNATIFAYGVTGSGKTWTMTGGEDDENEGIIPRSITLIFKLLRQEAEQLSNGTILLVTLSYVEIYNDEFRDLLSGSRTNLNASINFRNLNAKNKIEIKSNGKGGYDIVGSPTLRTPVASCEDAMELIKYGNKYRATGKTNLNEHSSRSHAIITLHVESRDAASSVCMYGKLNLVDLAGAENVAESGVQGGSLLETSKINLSLSALGNVLSALSVVHSNNTNKNNISNASSSRKDNKIDSKTALIPYRNSKLTLFLKDSLGGNSRTVMITNIRLGHKFFRQTRMSLMYAARAKNICNTVGIYLFR